LYYATLDGQTFTIHETASGGPILTIGVQSVLQSHMVNGSTFTICYEGGAVEVYDLNTRSRIR
jgi:hypothetical protein